MACLKIRMLDEKKNTVIALTEGYRSQHDWFAMGFYGGHPMVNESSKCAFTPNVKSVLSENLGGILGGTQC
jgi:hypothetical protein